MSSPIRVLLVEDSPIALAILKRMLKDAPELEIVGTARDGLEALSLIPQVQPQVICTDLHMPKMGGLELTQTVMRQCPRPILVISASVQAEDTQTVFQLLDAGALDVFPKPRTGLASEYEQIKKNLVTKIRVLAGVSVFTQHRSASSAPSPVAPPLRTSQTVEPALPTRLDIRSPRVLTIGASTGGPRALNTILHQLPATFPVPILCAQHISEGFLQGLVDWLNHECALNIVVAEAGMTPQAGTVYFAPERYHLEVNSQGRLMFSDAPPASGHRPSVTVLFKSIAAYYRRAAVGVLLTGMGRDGADGLQAIAEAGGVTLAQDEATSVVFGMPKAAIMLGAAQQVLPIQDIAPFLVNQIFVRPSKS